MNNSHKFLGLDIGLKRIGISFSPNGKIVFPISPVFRKNRNQASSNISKLLLELKINILIVGIPEDSHSKEEMQRRIKHFISLLILNNIKVYYQDEQISSYQARELSKGIFKHKKDGKLDSLSAKIILENWLNINLK